LREGGANYKPALTVGVGPYAGSILAEDLHGQSKASGLPDIVVPNTSGGVLVLPNLTK